MKINFQKEKILTLERRYKVFFLGINDFCLFIAATFLSSFLMLETLGFELKPNFLFILIPLIGLVVFYSLGIYRIVLRFINLVTLWQIFKAVTAYSILFFFFLSFSALDKILQISLLNWFIATLFIMCSRLFASYFLSDTKPSPNVLIYGAGSAGIQLANALRYSRELKPVAFIDGDESLRGTLVAGLKVHSHSDLEKLIERQKIEEVLIAIPSAGKAVLRNLLDYIEDFPVKVRILPGVAELAQGKVSVSELKEVDFEDLLGRIKVRPDQNLLDKNIKGKSILVTGGGGSIGSEICRQICLNNPKILVIFDSSEFQLYSIKKELDKNFSHINIEALLGNVTDSNRVNEVCRLFNIQTVFHSAAYKHVPIVEANPFEGIFNNVFGTLRCLLSALEANVETFVLISTDKAVRPTNIMGASKRLSELVLQAIANENSIKKEAVITMVRFGNVLGSSGSAVPLFQEQINSGGPITITDPEIIRYFMTITEAAELVIQAGALAEGGDVFVLNMGEPIKIIELAKRMVKLSGMEVKDDDNPDGEIEIELTGLR